MPPPTKTVAQRITELVDPIHINEVAQSVAAFNEYEEAKALLVKWKDSDARGTPTEIDLRDEKLASAQQNFDAAEAKLRALRGDDGAADQPASPSSAPEINSPAPLTTGDIAHSFSGLHWSSEKAWKKPLADKPKWLRNCVAIPGHGKFVLSQILRRSQLAEWNFSSYAGNRRPVGCCD
jgi:hypothetical protein